LVLWLEEDWSRVDLAVEEFLRFITPVQFTKPRYVRRDIELGGVRLAKGDKIMVMLAAANMDPRANPDPDRLDLQRKPNRHIAFGTGIHFCLGHQLARIEGRCALKSLFRRWPALTLAVDQSEITARQILATNHGGFSATIVAGSQHLANIWAKTSPAIACAAF